MPTTVHSAFQRSLSTNAEKQVAARRHGAQQARHGSQSPRRRWPVSPLIRAGAVLVHVAGRVAGEDGGAHRVLRPGARRRAETDATSITWPAPSLPHPALQQFLEGSSTRWLQVPISVCGAPPSCCCTAVQSE